MIRPASLAVLAALSLAGCAYDPDGPYYDSGHSYRPAPFYQGPSLGYGYGYGYAAPRYGYSGRGYAAPGRGHGGDHGGRGAWNQPDRGRGLLGGGAPSRAAGPPPSAPRGPLVPGMGSRAGARAEQGAN